VLLHTNVIEMLHVKTSGDLIDDTEAAAAAISLAAEEALAATAGAVLADALRAAVRTGSLRPDDGQDAVWILRATTCFGSSRRRRRLHGNGDRGRRWHVYFRAIV